VLQRLFRRRRRRADVLMALLLALLGFAAVVQVRATQEDQLLETARQEDLVAILDDLSNRNDRLREEIGTLTDAQERLTSGTDSTEAALEEAQRRAQLLGVLAGTVPARGPGVLLTISDPDGTITADVLLDALAELRDAGAEAMQLEGSVGPNGAPGPDEVVRIVASTSLLDAEGGLVVDGAVLHPPYRFVVVGDPGTITSALGIPGGVIDTVEQRGGNATVERRAEVLVDALRPLDEPQYARPAPEDGDD
jgi:uncharacterized protein YlxW (UPF0749 family)